MSDDGGRVVRWRWVAALAVLVAAPAVHAQLGLFEPDAVEAAPASYVLDHADLFRHDTATLRRISERLAAFDARHGMPVYLAVFGGLIGETVGSKAYDLQAAWLGERYGFVLVFDSDTGELGLGRPLDAGNAPPLGRPARQARLPSYELLDIMLRVNERLTPDAGHAAHLDRLTAEIVAEFDASLARLEAPGSRAAGLRFGLVVVGVIAGLGLAGLLLARLLARSADASVRCWRLPAVRVARRLGAPCGGGHISSGSYRGPAAGGGTGTPPSAGGAG